MQKGRHTTRVGELLALSGGGLVADTPGLRELGVWDVDPGEGALADEHAAANDTDAADCESTIALLSADLNAHAAAYVVKVDRFACDVHDLDVCCDPGLWQMRRFDTSVKYTNAILRFIYEDRQLIRASRFVHRTPYDLDATDDGGVCRGFRVSNQFL